MEKQYISNLRLYISNKNTTSIIYNNLMNVITYSFFYYLCGTKCNNIMRASIIQVGNSKGIILPSNLLKKLNLTVKASVDIEIEDNAIVIKALPRQGWAEAARQMRQSGDDKMLLPEVFEDENLSELSW